MGFFDIGKLTFGEKVVKTRKRLGTPKVTGCEACGLYSQVKSPRMPWTGEGRRKALMLGEAPGATEDQENEQFRGKAGQIFRKSLAKFGFDLDTDFWKDNVIGCRPTDSSGNNRTPTKREINYCEPRWRKNVEDLKPEFIFLVGGAAVEAFFKDYSFHVRYNLSITRWRGLCVPDPVTKAWVLPIVHPSYLNYTPNMEHQFDRDLKWALDQLSRKPPQFEDWSKQVHTFQKGDVNAVIALLDMIIRCKLTVTIDYETSNIRPYKPGNKIWSIGLTYWIEGEGYKAFSFPLYYPGAWTPEQLEKIKKKFTQMLQDFNVKKIAQNIQMEESWSRGIFGTPVRGWIWDTMVNSHILDERTKFTTLDFQVFLNWGYEYGESIAPFKEAKEGAEFNRMHEAPLQDLLIYNGLDAYFTYRLKDRQLREIARQRLPNTPFNLFLDGIEWFADMEWEGLPINTKYYEQVYKDLTRRIGFIERKLKSGPEAQMFFKKTGTELDLASNTDISRLLFDCMGLKSVKQTAKGGNSVDVEVMDKVGIPFTKDLVKMRKLRKTQKTYILPFIKLSVNDRIHPNENLHLVRTYRSSSDTPNLHNITKRDKSAMKMVRGGIIPSPGNKICAPDYGGHEIRIIACYSKDKTLVKDIINDEDIHKRESIALGLAGCMSKELMKSYGNDPKAIDKLARFDAKNSFVFAEFYGSYYVPICEDLIAKGYRIDEQTVKEVEEEFWGRYADVRRWQYSLVDFYKAHGYVEMLHGFRRRGYLTRNKIFNSPVQGTAFHCLLWSGSRANKVRKREEWLSKFIGQIHDQIMIDLNPKEEGHVIEVVRKIMTEDIRKAHPWIIVPLKAEFEITEIDEPWSTIKEEEHDSPDDYEESTEDFEN